MSGLHHSIGSPFLHGFGFYWGKIVSSMNTEGCQYANIIQRKISNIFKKGVAISKVQALAGCSIHLFFD